MQRLAVALPAAKWGAFPPALYQLDSLDETAAADVANQLVLAGQEIEAPAPQFDHADRLLDHEPAAAQDSSGDERIPMPALTFALQPNRSAVGVRAGGPDRRAEPM